MESFAHIGVVQWATVVLFVVGFVFLFVWRKFFPKVPGVIALAPIGILLGYLSQVGTINVQFQTLFSKFGDISGSFWAVPKISFVLSQDVLLGAAAVAVVAILETWYDQDQTQHSQGSFGCGSGKHFLWSFRRNSSYCSFGANITQC
jgi:MFS superfamily sulfate permease-like transporter